MVYVSIKKSQIDGKKYTAVFYDNDKKKMKTSHFGAVGYEDYTIHKDDERKKRYISRHSKENFNDYMTPGSLSKHILWNKTTLKASIDDYVKRFGLKKI